MTTHWPSRIAAFSLWALAGLSATYWLLKIVGASEAPITAGAIAIEKPAVAAADLARVLGPTAAGPLAQVAARSPATGARMQLLGVVSSRKSAGVALILVEGQPARPYRVGSAIEGGYTLTRISPRSATLTPIQDGADAITLELASPIVDQPARQTPLAGPARPARAALARSAAASARTPKPKKK